MKSASLIWGQYLVSLCVIEIPVSEGEEEKRLKE